MDNRQTRDSKDRSLVDARRFRIESDVARSLSLASLVVGHDRQGESRDAIDVAIGLATRLSAHLHVVHAVNLSDYPVDPELDDWGERANETLAEERVEVAKALSDHAFGWTYHGGHGDPAKLLMNVADEHDALMIIVGSRGEGWRLILERLLDPPVSHRLIQHAHRPVLVVSHPLVHSDGY